MKRIKAKEPAGTPAMATGNGHGKVRLLTRSDLDGRTRARKAFDRIAAGIAADLGGKDQLTTIQALLIEAVAGTSLTLNDLNTRALRGETIDLPSYAQAVSTLVRVASRLGTGRVPKDVTPSLGSILREDLRRQPTGTSDG
jgi:hypothetical protein